MPDLTRTSKHLSYVLRHRPESIGVVLDGAGWVDIDVLLEALREHGRTVTRAELDRVVAGTDKRRFEVSGGRIRAAQGHSVDDDLELTPVRPPTVLYHGTVARFVAAIRANGLRPGKRRHVHLSADTATAATVGARRGEPVILSIDAAGMHSDGHEFYLAANGVWLTDHVPPRWITEP
jgi:putative RNA 2'-phosphotransferase